MTDRLDKQTGSMPDDEVLITNFEVGDHPGKNFSILKLKVADGRSLSIQIGKMEAQIFGLNLPDLPPLPRITVFDIIIAVLEVQNVTFEKAVIHDRKGRGFVVQLHFADANGENIIVETTLVYAAPFAFITRAPLYAKNKVLDFVDDDNTAIRLEDMYPDYTIDMLGKASVEEIAACSPKDIEKYLNLAIEKENYELSEKIRTALQQQNSITK